MDNLLCVCMRHACFQVQVTSSRRVVASFYLLNRKVIGYLFCVFKFFILILTNPKAMPRPSAKVWIFFTKNDSKTATCKKCFKIVKYCGNTSNLHKHLSTRHGISQTSPAKVKKSKEDSG